MEETRKNMVGTAKKLDSVLDINFISQKTDKERKSKNIGSFIFIKDEGYPSLRKFPAIMNIVFSENEIGKKWEADSIIVTQPKPENKSTRIPVYAQYEYAGKSYYNKQNVNHVKAEFSMRYSGGDVNGDQTLLRSEGKRSADIYLNDVNNPLFIRQKIDETYFYDDNSTVRLKGFILHFYDYPKGRIKMENLIPPESIYENSKPYVQTEKENNPSFKIMNTKRGLMFSFINLQFEADKPVLIKGEDKKIDEIYKVLQSLKFKKLFIEGHTANTGNTVMEKKLSEERAKMIADELSKRGIPSGVFIYSGAGSSKPIAPNTDEKNKALNRRVEITVMQ